MSIKRTIQLHIVGGKHGHCLLFISILIFTITIIENRTPRPREGVYIVKVRPNASTEIVGHKLHHVLPKTNSSSNIYSQSSPVTQTLYFINLFEKVGIHFANMHSPSLLRVNTVLEFS